MYPDSGSSHHWVCYFRIYAVGPGSNFTASDEILNGKTHDKNSHFFAQYCFERGIELCVLLFSTYSGLTLSRRRIEVIPDIEEEMCVIARLGGTRLTRSLVWKQADG